MLKAPGLCQAVNEDEDVYTSKRLRIFGECLSSDGQDTLQQLVAKLFTLLHLDSSSRELEELVGAVP